MRLGFAVLAVVLSIAGGGLWIWALPSDVSRPLDRPADARSEPAASSDRHATLYCEFTNFADRTPLVGFYFLNEGTAELPKYALIFQREKDGQQTDFSGETTPRPEWKFDGSESPAVMHSPDDAIAINLYNYDSSKIGTTWFEAGLRSIYYRNLGGKCRNGIS